ncbi:MAG: signal peptidase II [Demequinaceae bacterium]|nr:signal peptidase II [Demequinaceae bacterium]
MKFRLAVWLVALGVLAVDYATKVWAIRELSDGHRIDVIGSHLTLKLVHNEGAALSILRDYGIGITAFMIVVIAVLVWYHGRASGPYSVVVFGAALGGAFGNLFDRLARGEGWGRGPVVDMINYGDFFIGNVADIAIVCAAAATIAASWTKTPMLRPRGTDAEVEQEEDLLGE